jgi:metal-dependent amidase/aminoacylase/carboxypeptidase family protein
MATDSDITARRQAIATAIAAELERQARDGALRIDIDALAAAIDDALAPDLPVAEGKRPEELNATNDD